MATFGHKEHRVTGGPSRASTAVKADNYICILGKLTVSLSYPEHSTSSMLKAVREKPQFLSLQGVIDKSTHGENIRNNVLEQII